MEPSNQQEIEAYFRSLPPGYQFMPNDAELILYYLKRKILNQELPINRIHDVNIYQYHPQTLTGKYYQSYLLLLFFFSFLQIYIALVRCFLFCTCYTLE